MLELAMQQVHALEQLNDPEYAGRLDTEGFYRLLLRAGLPPREAQRAANQRGYERLVAGEKM